jgi:hypothetical protein
MSWWDTPRAGCTSTTLVASTQRSTVTTSLSLSSAAPVVPGRARQATERDTGEPFSASTRRDRYAAPGRSGRSRNFPRCSGGTYVITLNGGCQSRWHLWVQPGGMIMCWNPALCRGFQHIDCGLGVPDASGGLDRVSGPLHGILSVTGNFRTPRSRSPDLHSPGEPTPNKITSELTPNRNTR